mmetsp:Transcript_4636/g.17152  ORF Transcript_4636/g.17152 Transcript_4636/m.17152 type:complete len:456 (-) Transcript_4636:1157-2524(-)
MPRAVNEHEAGETNSATGVGGAVIFEGECVVRGTCLVGVAVGVAVGVSETNATKRMGGGRAALPVSISKRESVSPPVPFASFARAATRALRLCFVVTLPEGPVPNNNSVSDAVRYPTSLPDADMSVVATSEIPPPARRSSFLLRRLFLTTAESKFSIMPDCTGTTGSSLTRERGFTTTGVLFADSGDCFLGVGIVNPSRKGDTGAVAGRGGNFFVDVVFFSTASSVGRAGSTGVAPAPFALSPRKSSPRRGRLSDFAEAAEAVCASNSACSFAAAASRSESRFTRSSSNSLDVSVVSSSSASIISSPPVSFSETPDAPLSVLSPLRFVRAFAFLALFRAPRCASRRSVSAAVSSISRSNVFRANSASTDRSSRYRSEIRCSSKNASAASRFSSKIIVGRSRLVCRPKQVPSLASRRHAKRVAVSVAICVSSAYFSSKTPAAIANVDPACLYFRND